MKTLVYKISISDEDKAFVKNLQKGYSIDFRKLYNNLDLSTDNEYLSSLNTKSVKFREYLIKEVISFKEKFNLTRTKIEKNIQSIQNSELNKHNFKKLVNLKRSLKSNICFGGRLNLQKRTKGLISNQEFKDNRLYAMSFYGETSTNGNRYFDLNDIQNGNIIFKLNKDSKINIKISNKKHKNDLIKIQEKCLNKLIPITIKLTNEKIFITFDEKILNDTNFNFKKCQKEKPKNLNIEDSKNYWISKHQEHEYRLKHGKLDRYLAIDINPNEIGFCITDSSMNIINKGCYKIIGKVSENKRRFEYSQIIKELFILSKHYKVSYFIIEDLQNLSKDNFGNNISNRKNKMEFKKNYIFSLVERRCNEVGLILRRVNPCYSSFIGNLVYNEYDPIASSLEICRRGIGQFTKGFKLIPDFDLDNIITDKIDDYVNLNQVTGFVDLFKTILNKSYRRKDISFSSQKFSKYDKSHVCLCF